MAKVALNLTKAYYNGFIADLEKSRYFQLHKNAATRADLYSFAIAKIEGKGPTDIQTVNSLFVPSTWAITKHFSLPCITRIS